MKPAVLAIPLFLGMLGCGAALAQAPQPAPDRSQEGDRRQELRDAEQDDAPRGPGVEGEKRGLLRRVPRDFAVTWRAPEPLRDMLEKFLPPPRVEEGRRRGSGLRPWLRDVRRRVPEIAASEGYFSASLDIAYEGENRERVIVTVVPGPRTTVDEIDIDFRGDLAGEGEQRERRRRELREGFRLKRGEPFRSADWETAKTHLEEALGDEDYAVGAIADSEAVVDAEAAKAALKLVLDSGPRFTFGDVEVVGLEEYPLDVVRRMVDLRQGERFSRKRLSDLQRDIQNGPWFASVVVDVERDPTRAAAAPVKVSVVERPSKEVGLALGYGTDDGGRAEAAFRHRNVFGRGYDLQSSLRAGEKRQIAFADLYFPPTLWRLKSGMAIPYRDSAGVLVEHNEIENLRIERFAVAAYRHFKLDHWETRPGLSYQIERSLPQGSRERIKRALAPLIATTWRNVDDLFDPRRGGVLNVQFAAATRALASSQDFFKAYGQYQHWFSFGPDNQLLLRTELGLTIAESREGIPEDFLFRAGGSRSNRGYAYQSLGVREGEAIVGGRYMATATAEFVHWVKPQWGAAVFTDIGDAADTRSQWQANVSYGVGARYKTPAGPFALDLAYAERERRFRLSFSVTVAF